MRTTSGSRRRLHAALGTGPRRTRRWSDVAVEEPGGGTALRQQRGGDLGARARDLPPA